MRGRHGLGLGLGLRSIWLKSVALFLLEMIWVTSRWFSTDSSQFFLFFFGDHTPERWHDRHFWRWLEWKVSSHMCRASIQALLLFSGVLFLPLISILVYISKIVFLYLLSLSLTIPTPLLRYMPALEGYLRDKRQTGNERAMKVGPNSFSWGVTTSCSSMYCFLPSFNFVIDGCRYVPSRTREQTHWSSHKQQSNRSQHRNKGNQ